MMKRDLVLCACMLTAPVAARAQGLVDVYKDAVAKGTLPPGMHTNRFAPVPQPTLDTGVKALTTSAIALLQ